MAFVAILPTAGTLLTSLGSMASALPVIGGTLGSIGGGLGGTLSALGAGNLTGALSSLGGMGSGLYTGADKLLGGFLPNIGGAGIVPAEGFLGSGGLNLLTNNPTFGGGPFSDVGLSLEEAALKQNAMANPGNFSLDEMGAMGLNPAGLMPGNAGGFFGMGGGEGGGLMGMAKGLKKKVDPVLGPIAGFTEELKPLMNVINSAQANPQGTTQTPAQRAQDGTPNKYEPVQKSSPVVQPVNIAPPQSLQSAFAQPISYVPIGVEETKEQNEKQEEEFREMLEEATDFLKNVQSSSMYA